MNILAIPGIAVGIMTLCGLVAILAYSAYIYLRAVTAENSFFPIYSTHSLLALGFLTFIMLAVIPTFGLIFYWIYWSFQQLIGIF